MTHGISKNLEGKWLPKNRDELLKLVKDTSVHLGSIDTHLVTDMHALFAEEYRYSYEGISEWDVSSVRDMRGMFKDAISFNQPIDNWQLDIGMIGFPCECGGVPLVEAINEATT